MDAADHLFCEAIRRIVWARRSELRALTVTGEYREDLTDLARSYREEAAGMIACGLD